MSKAKGTIKNKKNKTVVDVVTHNHTTIEKFRKMKNTLGVVQLDSLTGKKLNTFSNRYQAAAWLLENGLTNYNYQNNIGKTRCCIAGALTTMLKKSPTAYGYTWKYEINPTNAEPTYRLPTGLNMPKNTLVSLYDKAGNRSDYLSIKDACASVGITSRPRTETLNRYCKNNELLVYIRKSV